MCQCSDFVGEIIKAVNLNVRSEHFFANVDWPASTIPLASILWNVLLLIGASFSPSIRTVAPVLALAAPVFSVPWQSLPCLFSGLLACLAASAANSRAIRLVIQILLATSAITQVLVLLLVPPMKFPKLSGPFKAIGVVSDTWEHIAGAGTTNVNHAAASSAAMSGQAEEARPRQLPIQIYYPAEPSWKDRLPWHGATVWTSGGPNSRAQLKSLAAGMASIAGLPSFLGSFVHLLFSHIRSPGPAINNATPASTPQRFPVVIASHGLFGWKSYSSFIYAELASHGFVVIATDHPGCAAAAVDERGKVVSKFTLFGRGELVATSQDTYAANMRLRHADLVHIGRRVVAIARMGRVTDGGNFNGVHDPPLGVGVHQAAKPASAQVLAALAGRLDKDRISLIGHSYGGGSVVCAISTHGIVPPAAAARPPGCDGAGDGDSVRGAVSARSRTASQAHQPAASSHIREVSGQEDDTAAERMRGMWVPGPEHEPVFVAGVGLDAWMWPVPEAYMPGRQVFRSAVDDDDIGDGDESEQHKRGGDDQRRAEHIRFERLLRKHGGDDLATAVVRASEREVTSAPVLFLCSDTWHYAAEQVPAYRAVAARHPYSHMHQIRGSTHLSFTDIPVVLPHWLTAKYSLSMRRRGAQPLEPVAALQLVATYSRLFLQAHSCATVPRHGKDVDRAKEEVAAGMLDAAIHEQQAIGEVTGESHGRAAHASPLKSRAEATPLVSDTGIPKATPPVSPLPGALADLRFVPGDPFRAALADAVTDVSPPATSTRVQMALGQAGSGHPGEASGVTGRLIAFESIQPVLQRSTTASRR